MNDLGLVSMPPCLERVSLPRRLRWWADRFGGPGGHRLAATLREAADELQLLIGDPPCNPS